jgi:hypothetical protein
MEKQEQVFIAAAILLAAAVGQRHEPVDDKQVSLAVDNAKKLYAEVKRRQEEDFAAMPLPTEGLKRAAELEAKRTEHDR